MRNYYTRSTHKFEKNTLNEDAAIAKKNMIAVSDGAGGGGVFADRWSKYLLMKPSGFSNQFLQGIRCLG